MSTQEQPSEEEIRAAYEAQLKKLRVEHLLLDNVVTLINLGMRRTGLARGTEEERDVAQVRLAIESIRALLPLVEQSVPEQMGQLREALSQLQLAFVQIGGQQPGGEDAATPTTGEQGAGQPPPAGRPQGETSEGPGPAQRSGRLWVPGK